MIDLKTGRISFGEGKEIWPGMTREDFIKSKLFQQELRFEEEKEITTDIHYTLKNQKLYDKEVVVTVFFIMDFVGWVELMPPLMIDCMEWPDDYDYHENMFHESKKYDDYILSQALGAMVKDGEPIQLGLGLKWDSIKSLYDIRTPRIELRVDYEVYDFIFGDE